jgi:hypothetical protein
MVHAVFGTCAGFEIAPRLVASQLAVRASVVVAVIPAVVVQLCITSARRAVRASVAATSGTVIMVVSKRRSRDRQACDEHCNPPTLHSYLLGRMFALCANHRHPERRSAALGSDRGETRRS